MFYPVFLKLTGLLDYIGAKSMIYSYFQYKSWKRLVAFEHFNCRCLMHVPNVLLNSALDFGCDGFCAA
jgi:hypothetical protein